MMTADFFKPEVPTMRGLILNLWLATLIVLAGFVSPQVHDILSRMNVLPMLGLIIVIIGAALVSLPEPKPEAKTVDELAEVVAPPMLSDVDQWVIAGQLSSFFAQAGDLDAQKTLLLHKIAKPANPALAELPLTETVKYSLERIRPLLPATLMLQAGDLSRVKGRAVICETQMSQLLALLILNAACATEGKGMTAIHLRAANDTAATLVIADNRTAVPDETDFMAAAKIIRSWGGDINIEFQSGKGLHVNATLPLVA